MIWARQHVAWLALVGMECLLYMVPDLHIAWILAPDISCLGINDTGKCRLPLLYSEVMLKYCHQRAIWSRKQGLPMSTNLDIWTATMMKTSVIVRQTEIFISTASTCTTQCWHIILSQPTRRRTSQKTVIELINQINTWHRFEGPASKYLVSSLSSFISPFIQTKF
jgi:hypothetical protein